MRNKNTIFDSVIDGINFKYRNRKHQKDIQFHNDDFIIMRLANLRKVKIEKDFLVTNEEDEPSSLILIDNRDFVQRIAIERNSHSFYKTDTIKNILELNIKNALKEKLLDFSITKEYLPSEFWDICDENKGKVTKVVFSYKYPNLGRAHEELKRLLNDSSSDTNSQETQITYQNNKGLDLQKDNEVLNGCVKDSSEGGEAISMRIKGFKKFVKTGKTEKSIQIDEAEITNGNVNLLKSHLGDL